MDLGAYIQIEDLEPIAKASGIDIPRLRGYRLMKHEEPYTEEYIRMAGKWAEVSIVNNLCRAEQFWNPKSCCFTYSSYTDYLCSLYLEKDSDGNYSKVRWDRIHGKKRTILKFEIKKMKRRIREQYETFDKYCGREDVLYIHSRMGGEHWKWFEGKEELMNQPWFLDRVDDYWDSTYCDFYAKLNDESLEMVRKLESEISEEIRDENR